MWGDKYGEFHFVGSLGICLQKLHMKFVFEPNFYNFEYWKSELGLDWLLQHFHHCNWLNSLLCHIYQQFSFFFHHILHSSYYFFGKCYTYPMGMTFFKYKPNSLRSWKINLDHYTYMRKNGDIPPWITISLVFEVQKSKFS
jgi:hypothetical protein